VLRRKAITLTIIKYMKIYKISAVIQMLLTKNENLIWLLSKNENYKNNLHIPPKTVI